MLLTSRHGAGSVTEAPAGGSRRRRRRRRGASCSSPIASAHPHPCVSSPPLVGVEQFDGDLCRRVDRPGAMLPSRVSGRDTPCSSSSPIPTPRARASTARVSAASPRNCRSPARARRPSAPPPSPAHRVDTASSSPASSRELGPRRPAGHLARSWSVRGVREGRIEEQLGAPPGGPGSRAAVSRSACIGGRSASMLRVVEVRMGRVAACRRALEVNLSKGIGRAPSSCTTSYGSRSAVAVRLPMAAAAKSPVASVRTWASTWRPVSWRRRPARARAPADRQSTANNHRRARLPRCPGCPAKRAWGSV